MKKIVGDIACYCRVSTKKSEQLLSLENQKSFFEEFAKRSNIVDYKLYVDEGISAKSMKKRDNFNRMVEDARKGFISRILVKDISRFSRNVYDFLGVIRELKRINVKVEFITYNMTTEDSEFALIVLAAVAQEESANLSKRVKFGKKEGARYGRVPSCVYGYKKVEGDKYLLEIIEDEAATVKRIFDLYVSEQMSAHQIAALLNQEEIPTKRGGKYIWGQAVISGILRNRLYIGQVCNNKSEIKDFISGERKEYAESEWVIVKRPEFRIVSDEVWQKADIIRRSRSNAFYQYEDDGVTKSKRVSVKYPLSNLLTCANDKYSFRRRDRRYPSGSRYIYWTCSKRDLGAGKCDNRVKVDENQMHSVIAVFIKALFANHESIGKQFRAKVSKALMNKYEHGIDAKSVKDEQHKLLQNRDKLMELFLDGSLDSKYLAKKVKQIERKLNKLQALLHAYDNQANIAADIEKCIAIMMGMLDKHNGEWLDNALLKSIFDKLVVYSDGKLEAAFRMDDYCTSNLTIPFCELVYEDKNNVPNHTDDI